MCEGQHDLRPDRTLLHRGRSEPAGDRLARRVLDAIITLVTRRGERQRLNMQSMVVRVLLGLAAGASGCVGGSGGSGGSSTDESVGSTTEADPPPSTSGLPASSGAEASTEHATSDEGSSEDATTLDPGAAEEGSGDPCNGPMLPPDQDIVWGIEGVPLHLTRIGASEREVEAAYALDPAASPGEYQIAVDVAQNAAIGGSTGVVILVSSDPSRCRDIDGDGRVETSTSGRTRLPWGEDECVTWTRDLGEPARGLAWSPPRWDSDSCAYQHDHLWVASTTEERVRINRLDVRTGAVDTFLDLPELMPGAPGPHWAVTTSSGDLYFIALLDRQLVRVDASGSDHQRFDVPDGFSRAWGLARDQDDGLWISDGEGSVGRFDPADSTWNVLLMQESGRRYYGTFARQEKLLVTDANITGDYIIRTANLRNEPASFEEDLPVQLEPNDLSLHTFEDVAGRLWTSGPGTGVRPIDAGMVGTLLGSGQVHAGYAYGDLGGAAMREMAQ